MSKLLKVFVSERLMRVSDRCGTTHKRTLRKHATLTRVRFDVESKSGVVPVGVREHRGLDQAVDAAATEAESLPVVVVRDEVLHVHTDVISAVKSRVVPEEETVSSS